MARAQGTRAPGSLTSPKLTRVSRTALADEVYEQIKTLLMDNAFEPHTHLTTDWLAGELDVSRTPVRESLVRLEAEGLIVKRPMAGYSVRPPLDQAGLEELYAVRRLLEPEAARMAATKASAEQLDALAATGMHAVPQAGARYKEYRSSASSDAQFHDGVALASGNSLLRQSISRLHAHVHNYRLWATAGTPIVAAQEHAVILKALRARDPEAAAAAMRAHLDGAQERLRSAFG